MYKQSYRGCTTSMLEGWNIEAVLRVKIEPIFQGKVCPPLDRSTVKRKQKSKDATFQQQQKKNNPCWLYINGRAIRCSFTSIRDVLLDYDIINQEPRRTYLTKQPFFFTIIQDTNWYVSNDSLVQHLDFLLPLPLTRGLTKYSTIIPQIIFKKYPKIVHSVSRCTSLKLLSAISSQNSSKMDRIPP